MLSRLAKSGEIQLLFVIHERCRLIDRSLKSTKAGNDSVTTKLFRVNQSVPAITQHLQQVSRSEIVSVGTLLTEFLAPRLEEITVTSQKEVEQMIADLIPPREVVFSSCILMQDAESIFDMTPTTRIQVFKQLFNLLDMDVAREKLLEMKKRVQIRRQVLQEDTAIPQKFQRLFQNIQKSVNELTHTSLQDVLAPVWDLSFFQDIKQLPLDQLNIVGYTLSGYDATVIQRVLITLKSTAEEMMTMKGGLQQLQLQCEHLREEKKTLDLTIEKEQQALRQIDTQLAQIDQTRSTHLRQEILSLQQTLDTLRQRLPLDIAGSYGLVFSDRSQLRTTLAERIQTAKQLQQQQAQLEQRLATLTSQHQSLLKQEEEQRAQLHALSEQRQESEKFRCDKIHDHCTYVELMREGSIKTIDDQTTFLRERQLQLSEKELPAVAEQIGIVKNESSQVDEQIASLKALFTALDRKTLEPLLGDAKQIEETIASKQKELSLFEQKNSHLLERNTEKQRLEATLSVLTTQKDALTQRLITLEQQVSTAVTAFDPTRLEQIQQVMVGVQALVSQIDQLQELLDSYATSQQEIRILTEKEGHLKELLSIFQTELLIVVLQDFLPVIEEVINDYLRQVVPFVLHFELPTTMQEEMELSIWIEDEKGRRAVKSLSGGQRALLRLCRILAVSSCFKQRFLFLDETINSLDQEAVGRVAEMLDGFVKQQTAKFFVVTHATQIQEMNFWTKIISLEEKILLK